MVRKPATWIRQRVFVLLCLIVFVAIGLSYYDQRVDTALVLYGCIIVLLSPVVAIMTYRGVKRGASDMYWLIVLLAGGIVFSMANQVYVRYYYCLGDIVAYALVLNSVLWQMRNIVEVFVAAYLFAWVLGRTFGLRDNGYVVPPDDRVVYAVQEDVDDMAALMDARIVAGEIRFEGHTHEGLIIGAKLIVVNKKE